MGKLNKDHGFQTVILPVVLAVVLAGIIIVGGAVVDWLRGTP